MEVKDKWGEDLTAGDVIVSSDDKYYRVVAVGEDEEPYVVCRPLHQTIGLKADTVTKLFASVTEDYGDYHSEVDNV
jgi:hypothetical protein